MTANQKRVRQARCALKAYGHNRHPVRTDFYETEEAITDLIADLYHLAQSENIDVEAVARQALEHFKAELIADTNPDSLKRTPNRITSWQI